MNHSDRRARVDATLKQMLTMRQPSDVQLTDDGSRIAFVAAGVVRDRDGGGEARIWSGPVDGEVRQVTRGPGSDRIPRFSPDGSRLAFTSDRDDPGRASLFVLSPGLEAFPIGEVPGSIEDIRWQPGGEEIVVLAADAGSDTAGIEGSTVIGPGEAGDPEVRRPLTAWRRLYRVDLATGRTDEIGPGEGLTVWEFSLHDDRAIAVVSEDPTEGGWYHGWIAAIDLKSHEVTRLHEPRLQAECPRVSPDGLWLAWTENHCSDRTTVAGTLTVRALDGGEVLELATDADVTKFEWVDNSRLRVCGPRGLRAYVGTVSLATGELTELFSGQVRLGTLHQVCVTATADASLFAAVHEAPGVPPEVAVLEATEPGAGWREVSALNGHLKALPVPDVEEITWEADDGLLIEGLLVRPPGSEGPLPTIVNVHGGPTAAWEWSFSPGYWNTVQIFTEAGYAVLLPNPRGSAGRGREFAGANLGDLGGGDFRDILSGVDACVARGIAIDGQIGAWGDSYGGFMSCWLVGNTDRFGAIIPVACHSNWLSFHNTSNVSPHFDRLFLDADPYEADGRYYHRSPVVHAPKASTPTLFLHGAIDKICPLGQAEEMYRAIAEAGVETELVIYPREGHLVIGEYDHAVDALTRMLAWMDRHLLGIEP